MRSVNYATLKRYAKKYSEHYWGDIVHNIWLRYFENTGKNLFNEDVPNNYIRVAIRNEFLNSLYMRDRFFGLFSKIPKYEDKDIIWGSRLNLEEYTIEEPSIVNNMIYNEVDGFIKEKIKRYALIKSQNSNASNYDKTVKLTLDIYERLKMGYRNKDIAKELGISDVSVANYKKEIIKSIKYMALHNPFRGSRTQVKKSISQDTWDAKPKQEKQEWKMEDANEYYKLYVNSDGEGLLIKLRQPKINPYLQNQK